MVARLNEEKLRDRDTESIVLKVLGQKQVALYSIERPFYDAPIAAF
jgi:hypothetical protein